jgi:hypothetical protein
MGNFLYNIFHPEIFQGSISKRKYFEGWYYKLVSSDEHHVVAIIPGIAIFNKKDRHSFIQTFNGTNHTTQYHRFPIEDFKAHKKELSISIGNNHFSKNDITLDLPEIKGEISFSKLIPPKSSLLNPGIMGWYAFVPYMQCNHGIVSLFHHLNGHTKGDFGEIDWGHGIGYIEKDWGTSFPLCWIWLHCNHFHSTGPVSLMASVAHIPWLRRYFPGFMVIFRLDDKEYRFATYNYSKMKCLVFDDIVLLDFQKNDLCLSIKAYRGETASLQVPLEGQMIGKLNESLNSILEVTLTKTGRKIWSSTGTTAGLDVSGDIKILESAVWRN